MLMTARHPVEAPQASPSVDELSTHHAHHRRRGPNVLLLSAAGKPIFVRHPGPGGEESWATACGIVQGLRANAESFGLEGIERGASSLGDIQSLQAGRRLIVFKHTEALTLVSISDREDGNHHEAWLRLQLEYVYAQVIFTLTDQVQAIFKRSPGFDLRSMMGPNVDESIRNLLDRFDPIDLDEGDSDASDVGHGTGCGVFLTAGIECIHPIPPEIREAASRMLVRACGGGKGQNRSSADDLYAILMVGTRLLTIVQPSNVASQLHTSDLNLILTFVGRQPGLLTNELWFPLCLPRFDSSGFLYAFTSCLDPRETGLSIVLISHDNSTEQFESFRRAANTIRMSLGLQSTKSKVLRVFDSSTYASSSTTPVTGTPDNEMSRDVSAGDLSSHISAESVESERKNSHLDDSASEMRYEGSDYDDEEDEDKGIASHIAARRRKSIEGQPLDASLDNSETARIVQAEEQAKSSNLGEAPLLTALRVALSTEQQEEMMSSYLQLASAVHFVFRCDIYVGSGDPSGGIGADATGSMLTQCFGPQLSFPFTDASSQAHVWDTYARLSLRLRLGSASVETTMDALDAIDDTHAQDQYGIDSRGMSRECPMQCLLEAPPRVHSVTYVQEDNEWMFIGLNGKFFELYATLPATIAPKKGTAYCARLVRRLMNDERILFLSNPLTWAS